MTQLNRRLVAYRLGNAAAWLAISPGRWHGDFTPPVSDCGF
ncbi:MAG: hypothetical protein AB3N21_09010 [Ruegeria sp.]